VARLSCRARGECIIEPSCDNRQAPPGVDPRTPIRSICSKGQQTALDTFLDATRAADAPVAVRAFQDARMRSEAICRSLWRRAPVGVPFAAPVPSSSGRNRTLAVVQHRIGEEGKAIAGRALVVTMAE
jgi:hypothetical protein